MNKIIIFSIAFLASTLGFAQNADSTQQKNQSNKTDTIINYYDNNNRNNPSTDTIKNYYPPDNNQQPEQPQPVQPPTQDPPQGVYPPQRNTVNKQQIPEDPFLKNLYYGVNVSLRYYGAYGGSEVYYELSPYVGYKITDKISVGPQIIYNNTILYSGNYSVSYNIFGGGVFGRAFIFRSFFVQVEYDLLSAPKTYSYLGKITERELSDEKMAGIGFKNRLGDKLSYCITLMYDFAPTIYSPYFGNPLVYRAGLTYKF